MPAPVPPGRFMKKLSANQRPPSAGEYSSDLLQLIGYALDAMWIVDEDNIVKFMNPAAEALTGYDANDLTGRHLSAILPPDIAENHADYLRSYLERGGESTVLGKVRELSIVRRSGQEVPIELKAFEIGSECGKRRFGAVMRDITQRRENEKKQQQMLDEMQRLATEDDLTGLPNRREFFIELDRLVEFVRRYGQPACVAIIDIDLFKQINHLHGHDAGDKVLHAISGVMTQKLRGTDLLARIGGEEFGMLMPESEPEGAIFGLERLRDNVKNTPVLLPDGTEVTITVSIGMAAIDGDDATRHCIKAAGDALLAAKRSGRDRICLHDDEAPAQPVGPVQSAE